MRLSEIQQQIGSGQYRVEPAAVADAIVRRLLAVRDLTADRGDGGQPACS